MGIFIPNFIHIIDLYVFSLIWTQLIGNVLILKERLDKIALKALSKHCSFAASEKYMDS